jgi:hypothetical protein
VQIAPSPIVTATATAKSTALAVTRPVAAPAADAVRAARTDATGRIYGSNHGLSVPSRPSTGTPLDPLGPTPIAPLSPAGPMSTHDAPSEAGHTFPGSLAVLVAVAAAACLVAERLRYATAVRPSLLFASLIERPG